MRPSESANACRQFFADALVDLSAATCGEMIDTMLRFYRDVPAQGLSKPPQNDMLLFEYGIYPSLYPGNFRLSLTRQFAQYDTEDGEPPRNSEEYYGDLLSQLSCAAVSTKTVSLEALPKVVEWCDSVADLDGLRAFIVASPGLHLLRDLRPTSIEIGWSEV